MDHKGLGDPGRSKGIERDKRGRITKGVAQKTNKRGTAGRPLFDGKNEHLVVQKLEWAFSIGATDLEACNHAGISRTAFYSYQDMHPEFLDRKEVLKEAPTLKARKSIFDRLDDPEFALKYMERKKKGEFSPRQEWSVSSSSVPPQEELTDEQAKKVAESALKAIEIRQKRREQYRMFANKQLSGPAH